MTLLLSIFSATGIFILFKLIDVYKANTTAVISVNYFVACLLGFLLTPFSPMEATKEAWFPYATLIGVLFIIFFFLIAKSIQKAGLAVSTIAAKMSVIIPIIFSIVYFREPLSLNKIVGVPLAFVSVFLSVYQPSRVKKAALFLPFVLFVGLGVEDSIIKYTQAKYITNQTAAFSSVIFGVAFLVGLVYLFIRRQMSSVFQLKSLVLGLVLGAVNLSAIYFFIESLNHLNIESSIVFGINNIGIVALSVVSGWLFFKERFRKQQIVGLFLAVLSIVILRFF